MPRPRSTNTRRWKRPSLESRIADAHLVAERFRELARIAGEGSALHARMILRARAWKAKATRLTRKMNSGMTGDFRLSNP